MSTLPEAWLRGPVEGVPGHLQSVAHGLLHSSEELIAAIDGLSSAQLTARPNGVASIAFHVRHALGSLDRLFTYARGEELSEAQKRYMLAEKQADDADVESSRLIESVRGAVEKAVGALRGYDEHILLDHRGVGRANLPSTVIGLLSHAAEHTARHTGQVVTTARFVRSDAGSA